MKNLFMCLLSPVQVSLAAMGDDPWLTKVMTEVEYLQDNGEGVLEWNIDAWAGRDLSKFWIKSSGEYAYSEFEDANIEFVYSRAVSLIGISSLACAMTSSLIRMATTVTGFPMVISVPRRTSLRWTRECLSVRIPAVSF